jgi:YHS domain-containing protein
LRGYPRIANGLSLFADREGLASQDGYLRGDAMPSTTTNKQTDPVCGHPIDPDRSNLYTADYADRRFYFCSQGCLERFRQDRERFTRPAGKGLKGLWARYLARVQKATDGKPPCCH